MEENQSLIIIFFFLFVFFFCIENLPTGLQSPCSCVSRQLPVLTFVSSHSRCPCHCAVVLQGLVDCGLLQCISSRPKLLPSASQQARLGILIGLHLCACVCLSVCAVCSCTTASHLSCPGGGRSPAVNVLNPKGTRQRPQQRGCVSHFYRSCCYYMKTSGFFFYFFFLFFLRVSSLPAGCRLG